MGFWRRNSRGEKRGGHAARGRMAGNLLVLGVVLLVAFSFYLWRYTNYVRGLRFYDQISVKEYEPLEMEFLSPQESLNLSWFPTDVPLGSYREHSREKPPGTVRIGVFGDSFTQGHEAARGHEYPSFMEKFLKMEGYGNVEVINFGVSGYGIHQSYLMWKYLGREYDLDYILIMPLYRHILRDSSFIFRPRSYGTVHARLIDRDGQLEVIPVLGESTREASEIYYRFLQPWRYLRYDAKTPPFILALLPRNRQLKRNPFYHSRDSVRREIFETYVMIIEEMARSTGYVLVVANEQSIYGLKRQIASPNIQFMRSGVIPDLNGFIHKAPYGHYSGLGNRMRAEEIIHFLTGGKEAGVTLLEVEDLRRDPGEERPGEGKGLNGYDRVFLEARDGSVTSFYWNQEVRPGEYRPRPVEFRKSKIVSLLRLSLVDGRFAGLPFLLEDGARVTLSFEVEGRKHTAPVGRVSSSGEVMGRIVLDRKVRKKGLEGPEGRWRIDLDWKDPAGGIARVRGPVRDPVVLVGDDLALRGLEKPIPGRDRPQGKGSTTEKSDNGREYLFKQAHWNPLTLRSTAGQFVDPDGLGVETEPFYLSLKNKDGTAGRLPLKIGYRKRIKTLPPFEEICRKPLPKPEGLDDRLRGD